MTTLIICTGPIVQNYTIGYNETSHENYTDCLCTANFWANVTSAASIQSKLKEEKIILIILIFFGSFVCSLTPWVIEKFIRGPTLTILSLLNCLAGGVVVAVGFIHVLSDATSNLTSYFGNNGYPFSFLFCSASLLFLFCIDRLLLGGEHSHSDIDGIRDSSKDLPFDSSQTNIRTSELTQEMSSPDLKKGEQAQIGRVSADTLASKESIVTALVFVVALSIHSVFEGLGLGSEQDQHGLTALILAIVAHKLLEAFALGLSVFYAKFKWWQNLILLVIYATSTPVGVGIGWGATSGSTTASTNLINGILVSIAAGSLLYIGLIEILPTEFNKRQTRKMMLLRCAFMIFGWFLLALVAEWA